MLLFAAFVTSLNTVRRRYIQLTFSPYWQTQYLLKPFAFVFCIFFIQLCTIIRVFFLRQQLGLPGICFNRAVFASVVYYSTSTLLCWRLRLINRHCATSLLSVCQSHTWASIIGWTGGQVPPLFEVGGRNVFCPPTFWGNKYLLCVNLLFSCYQYYERWTLVCAHEDLQNFVVHLWARESGNFDLRAQCQ